MTETIGRWTQVVHKARKETGLRWMKTRPFPNQGAGGDDQFPLPNPAYPLPGELLR